jgi:hypothetical protein
LAWYALRAARPSWSNNFVDRISGVKAVLENALEPLAKDVAQVRVAIEEKNDELAEGQAEFTWQDNQATDEWNFANLSHGEP